jgi:tRNA U34 5-methylaminomethyl-2-thiouridine-forming methyltransferase MnmC
LIPVPAWSTRPSSHIPLPESLTGALDYASGLDWEGSGAYFAALHRAPWAQHHPVAAGFSLEKIAVALEDHTFLPGQYHVVYYDAFAPSVQPGMWRRENLTRVMEALETGGVLVTYCAQGQFRRDLRNLGFRVEMLPGPPGKREVLRAIKI